MASKYKAEGNANFKAKKYSLAIENYTSAISATPDNAVLYNNRAIAKLKSNDFAGAEMDCDKCIELDSSLVKAWFRRGTARKSLKKYNKALRDFETVLKMDPNNKAGKKEKIEVKNKLQEMYQKSKQKKFAAQKKNNKKQSPQKTQNNKNGKKKIVETENENKKEQIINDKDDRSKKSESKMRRIVIQECDDSDSDSSSEEKDDVKLNGNGVQNVKEQMEDISNNKDDTNKDALKLLQETEKFKIDKIPTNFLEFEKLWSRAKIMENRSKILMAFKDKKLYKIIKNFIDDTLFSEMIGAINYIAMNNNIKDALILLKKLTKLDRFEMIVMFMNDNDQKLLNQIKQKCQQNNLNISVFKQFE